MFPLSPGAPFSVARRAQAICIASVIAAIGCSAETKEPAAAPAVSQQGFDSTAARLLTALRADAVDSVMALVTDDVVLMPPNEPVLKGAAAVRTWYTQFLTQVRTAGLVVTDREVRMGGDWVNEVAGYEWTLQPVAGGADLVERGTYMQIWRREPDGRYRMVREVWNSTAPLPTSAGN